MGTCRAIRQLKPDPVPAELIDQILWAATRAPSPGNSQGWDFVVVDDPESKARIADAVRGVMAGRVAAMPRPDKTMRLMLDGTARLIDTLGRGARADLRRRPGDLPTGRAAGAVHLVGAVPGRAEHPRRRPRPRAGHDVHDAAHGRRADDPRGARHPAGDQAGGDDPGRLAGRQVRSGQPPAGGRRSSTATAGRATSVPVEARRGRPPKVDDAGVATRQRLLAAAIAACVEHGYEGGDGQRRRGARRGVRTGDLPPLRRQGRAARRRRPLGAGPTAPRGRRLAQRARCRRARSSPRRSPTAAA